MSDEREKIAAGIRFAAWLPTLDWAKIVNDGSDGVPLRQDVILLPVRVDLLMSALRIRRLDAVRADE